MCVSGSVRAALPVRAGKRARQQAPAGLPILLTTGGVNIGPIAYFFDKLHGFGAELRREVDQIVDRHARALVRRRLGRERLRRRIPLARHVAFRNRALLDRPDRLPGDAIEHVQHALLRRLRDGFHRAAVDRDVGENRRAGNVHVPDAVVDELVVPLPFAGLQIDGDEALAEQTVPRAMAAVVVAGRHLDRQIRQAELFVDRYLPPDAGVPGVDPRVLFPGVVAEFAQLRDRVEDPEPLAGPDVEPADVTLSRSESSSGSRRSCPAAPTMTTFLATIGVACRPISPFIGSIDLIVLQLQIHDAAGAEAGDRRPGLRVQRDQAIARRHVENALLAAVGPVGEAAARQLPRRGGAARALPARCASTTARRCRIERDDGAPAAGGGVEHAVGHQRRAFVLDTQAADRDCRS